MLYKSILAAAVFTAASIGTYFINDVIDHELDRAHPKKRSRPVAAGYISRQSASVVGVALLIAALAVSALWLNTNFLLLITAYVGLTLSYSLWLKRVAVFDLACVAAGFILRMIAGGAATEIYISEWFLTVGCFSSLFVVAAKRYAELREQPDGSSTSRDVLAEYSTGFLRTTWTMALTVAVASYFQWTFTRADATHSHLWYQLSAIPWVLALLRYALKLESGYGGEPEEIFASDRVLQGLGIIWVAVFAIAVYSS